MEIGMLWFDDSPNSLREKVSQAVAFYQDKFGEKPTHCLVHPSTLNGSEGVIAGVQVREARNVMPNHYWIGIDEKARSARGTKKSVATEKPAEPMQERAA